MRECSDPAHKPLARASGAYRDRAISGTHPGIPVDQVAAFELRLGLLAIQPSHLLIDAWSFAVFARKPSLQALRQKRRRQCW